MRLLVNKGKYIVGGERGFLRKRESKIEVTEQATDGMR